MNDKINWKMWGAINFIAYIVAVHPKIGLICGFTGLIIGLIEDYSNRPTTKV